ncbi:MAG: hypothetical protein GXY52_02990 [Chloroflexi bacterium]|nr:hypothetical protein [Chloroflexota bacterium]
MYPVGSKVVHPCYGAGTITKIQEKEVHEETRRYYVIYTINRPMELMVAVENAESTGLRTIGTQEELRQVLAEGATLPGEDEINTDLRARQNEMREWLKSGNFDQVVNVVRQLFFLNSRRPLGSVDRQLFDQGKELLAGELALSSDGNLASAMHEIEGVLAEMVAE